MKHCLDYNLKVTEKQFALARRGLVEEQIRFKNQNVVGIRSPPQDAYADAKV